MSICFPESCLWSARRTSLLQTVASSERTTGMCRKCDRFFDYIDDRIEDGSLKPMVDCFNRLVAGLGNVLVYVVFIITLFLSFTSFAIMLPYEEQYKSPLTLTSLAVFGFYLLVNIMFHYIKARNTPPVLNPGTEGDPFCERCNHWKSEKAHHCSVCNTCILGMDHHCIWINQCVGAHNHRHFFLFIASLTLACLVILIAGFNTLHDQIFLFSINDDAFCNVRLHYAPLQEYICEYNGFAKTSVLFCYMLGAVLFFMVGGLTAWNIYLISNGKTYIEHIAQKKNQTKHLGWKRNFGANWRSFLGIRRSRPFWRIVLIPSTLPPITYESNSPGRYSVV